MVGTPAGDSRQRASYGLTVLEGRNQRILLMRAAPQVLPTWGATTCHANPGEWVRDDHPLYSTASGIGHALASWATKERLRPAPF